MVNIIKAVQGILSYIEKKIILVNMVVLVRILISMLNSAIIIAVFLTKHTNV